MSFELDWAIDATNITKKYNLYEQPLQRLKAILLGRAEKYTRPFTALDAVSLQVVKGSTVGIIGQNGSGKSTLLQIICGILAADTGQVRVTGRIASLLELGAGFNQDFTGKENLFLNAALLGLSRAETEARYEEIVRFADIGEFIDSPVKNYSSGMYVRLAFAIAIHVAPDILIVDEALAVGDARFQAKCFNKIQEIKENGATLLFVSHDINAVRQLCDQAIWLNKGKVKLAGEVLEVTSKYMEFLFQPEENAIAEPSLIVPQASTNDAAINHWGSDLGSIDSCHLLDAAGEPTQLIYDDALIRIKLRFTMPAKATPQGFGIALALRSLSGTDLVVYDSFGAGISFAPRSEPYEVEIAFTNPLNAGKYLLVAVLEDRSKVTPAYYEFIEGVVFFSVLRSQKSFGLFVPQVQLRIAPGEVVM